MRRLLLAVPALVLALGTAACGEDGNGGIATAGGGTSEQNGGGGAAPLTDEEQAQLFTQCMRDNGIDLPDPDPNGGGGLGQLRELDIPREELMAALAACRSQAPGGGDPQQRLQDPQVQAQLQQFAECMRDNGIDLPDPDPNGGFSLRTDLDRNDPEFQAALEACQEFFVGPGGGQ